MKKQKKKKKNEAIRASVSSEQAITRDNVDSVLCHQLASRGCNDTKGGNLVIVGHDINVIF